MFIATTIVSSLLALMLIFSATGKLRKDPAQFATLETVGFPRERAWVLAGLELAGAVGLVIGIFWWPIAVAAAIGVILYALGAAVAHLRVGDRKVAGGLLMLVLAAAALVLRLLAA